MSNSKMNYLLMFSSALTANAAFASNHFVGEKVFTGGSATPATIVEISDTDTYTVQFETGSADVQKIPGLSDDQITSAATSDLIDQQGPGGPGQPGPGQHPPGPQPGPQPTPHPGPGPQPGPGPRPHPGPVPRPHPGPGPFPGPQPYPYNTCHITSNVNNGGVGVFHVVTRFNQTIGTFFLLSQAQSYANNDYRCHQ